jgi:hypothetical protein
MTAYTWRVVKADARVEFATRACGRCGGSGRFGPVVVSNGVCFDCGGRGWAFSRPAARAFDALQAARLAKSYAEVEANPAAWQYTAGRPTMNGGYVTQVVRVKTAVFDRSARSGAVGVAEDCEGDGYDVTYKSDGRRWMPFYSFRVTWGERSDDAVGIGLTLREYATGTPSDFRRALTDAEVDAVLAAHSPKTAVRRKAAV